MKKIWVCLMAVILLSGFSAQQGLKVTGRVTSAVDGTPMPGVSVVIKGTSIGMATDTDGKYEISVSSEKATLVFSFVGYKSREVSVRGKSVIDVTLEPDVTQLSEVVVSGYAQKRKAMIRGAATYSIAAPPVEAPVLNHNTEEYEAIEENIFRDALKNPLSTFSIDVDAASYSNVRRFINNGTRPPKDAVRIEEMVNYFDYDYEGPTDDKPFAIHTEISTAPWNEKHKLLHIGLQGKRIPTDNLPPSNLVFLIDVSGSMAAPNKLPLVKSSLQMLVDQLREEDHVAIVVYAGAAGVVLNPTPGTRKGEILQALERLNAGGSTAGGEGLKLAYTLAKENFNPKGNNRIILATDGDFNVGESSNASMERLIEQKRKDGIFLTVLGYGMGNYKDSKMEILADKGNGNYAYIDNLSEARKVLITEFGGTLFTIAKDVKIQVEFNPAKVQAYRLIGYENRALRNEDFNNDKKDAGELGSGHTVTAMYEIIPVGVESEFGSIDDLKYQTQSVRADARKTNELLTLKLRYKKPDEETSARIEKVVINSETPLRKTSDNFRWAASVAAFGMLLRESEFVKDYSYDEVVQLAEGSRGDDKEGYRIEFINMVKSFGLVAKKN